MNSRQVTGNATHGTVTKHSTLITNKKLTLQPFRVPWPRLPSIPWDCLRVTLTEAGPARRAIYCSVYRSGYPRGAGWWSLWLSLGKNVPERRSGGRKDLGLAVRQTWACVAVT